MAHPIVNIVFEIVLLIGLACSVGLIWASRREIIKALRRADDRQPPRSSL